MPSQKAVMEAVMKFTVEGAGKIGRAIADQAAALATYKKQLDAIRASRVKSGKDAVKIGGETFDLTRTHGRNARAAKANAAALTELNEKVSKSVSEMAKLEVESKKTSARLAKLGQATKKTTKTQEKLRFALSKNQFLLRQFGRTLYFAGRDMMMFSAAIIGPMLYAVNVFMDVEQQISRVEIRLRMMGVSALQASEQARQLADQAIRIGKEWGYTARESVGALANLASAGLNATRSIEILEQATILARINFITMGQATEVLVQYLQATGRTADHAEDAIRELTVAQNNSFESLTSLAAGFGFAMTSLMEYGAASIDVTTAMTLFTKTGTSSTVAGRRLTSMYSNLVSKGDAYGVTIRDAEGNMLDMRDMMLNLRDASEFYGDEMIRQQFLLEVLGITGKDAYDKMIKAIESGDWDQMAEDFENAEIQAKDLADIVRDDLKVAFDELKASVENFLLTIGQWLVPTIEVVVGLLTTFTDVVQGLDDAIGVPLASTILGVGVAIGVLGLALAGAGMGISASIGGFAALGPAMVPVIDYVVLFSNIAYGAAGSGAALAGWILVIVVAVILLAGALDGLLGGLGLNLDMFLYLLKPIQSVAKIIGSLISIIISIVRIIYQLGRALGLLFAYAMKVSPVFQLMFAWILPLIAVVVILVEGITWLADIIARVAETMEAWATDMETTNDGFEKIIANTEWCTDLIDILTGAFETFTSIIEGVTNGFYKLFIIFHAFVDRIFGSLSIFGLLMAWFRLVVDIIFGKSPGLIPAFKGLALIITALTDPITSFIGLLRDIMAIVIPIITTFFTLILNFKNIIRYVQTFAGLLVQLVEALITGNLWFQVFSGIIGVVMDNFGDLSGYISTFASMLTGLLVDGPLEMVKNVLDLIKGTLEWLADNIKFSIEIDVDLIGAGADFLGGLGDLAGDALGSLPSIP